MPAKPRNSSRPSTKTPTYIALLRGINVGGKNKLSMSDLVELFIESGCTNVRTYIQSGNIVFSANVKAAPKLPGAIAQAITRNFGLKVPVVLRSAAELQSAIAHNPHLRRGVDPQSLHVAFLADTPAPKSIAALDSNRSPGDTFTVLGRDIFLHLSNGVARTKLTNAYFDSTLGTISTLRNWRTVLTLCEMAS